MADSLYYATIRYFSIAVLPVSFLVCFVIFFSNPGSLPSKGPMTRVSSGVLLGMIMVVAWAAMGPAAQASQGGSQGAVAFVVQPEADQPAAEIGRGYFALSQSGGTLRTVRALVKNIGQRPLRLRIYAVDGVQMVASGLAFSSRTTLPTGAGRWITVKPATLTLAPGEAERVRATVLIPQHATPGDHVSGVAFEDLRVQSTGAGSHVLIDVHERRALAVVVRVPGAAATAAVQIAGASLALQGTGSQAVVAVRNAGALLAHGAGTIEIMGGQATTGALPFTIGTLLPGGVAHVVVPLPRLALQPGGYTVRVRLNEASAAAAPAWQGSVTLAAPGAADAPASVPTLALKPLTTLAPAGAAASPTLWAGLGLLLIVLGVGLGLLVSRAGSRGATRGAA